MNNKKLNLISAVLFAACLISGCTNSNIPGYGAGNLNRDDFENKTNKEWKKAEPAISYVKQNGSLIIDEPMGIPSSISNMMINTQFSGSATFADLAGLLRPMGIFLVVPEEEIRTKSIVIFDYDGKLGDFLNAIGVAYGVSFNWNNGGVLTVESSSQYLLRIPQDKELAKSIATDIANLGAKDVFTSIEAGTVSYKADNKTHQRIAGFMKRNSINASLVSMQIAIITVALDKNRNTGIDWGNMSVALGTNKSSSDSTNNPNMDGNSGASSDSLSNGVANGLTSVATTAAPDFSVGGTSSNVNFAKGDFSLNAAINYLSTYGRTETSQSVLMKTLSGREVKIKSGQKIPYVDSIGVSTGTSESNVSSSSLASVEIKDVEIGLDLGLKPLYDAESETVTIDVDLNISSLLSFIELSAGNQMGKVTRPNTQTQEFTDVVKMKAGESVLIGGVSFETNSDNRSAPSFAEESGISSRSDKNNKNTMFIMIRPTVTVYGSFDKEKQIINK